MAAEPIVYCLTRDHGLAAAIDERLHGAIPCFFHEAGRVEVHVLPVYRAVETGASAPPAFDAVLVHSPRGGRAVAALGPFSGQVAVAISDAAAAPLASARGLELRVAARPDEAALFEALGKAAPRV